MQTGATFEDASAGMWRSSCFEVVEADVSGAVVAPNRRVAATSELLRAQSAFVGKP